MEFRMLLGHQAMQDFIIDPNNSFYFGDLSSDEVWAITNILFARNRG